MNTTTEETAYCSELIEFMDLLQSFPEEQRIIIVREIIAPRLPSDFLEDFEYMLTLPEQDRAGFVLQATAAARQLRLT